ncbi:MAG: alpha/beta hydrolase [Burkholderiaceae bacterium]
MDRISPPPVRSGEPGSLQKIRTARKPPNQLISGHYNKKQGQVMAVFVLIHGAYQGGWIWNQVADRIRRQGHSVYTPTLDGCGERSSQLRAGITTETHGAEIASFLYHFDLHDVVLAGTSAGGMVMACAAEQARDRIKRLAFIDALALMNGEKIRDIVTRPADINTEFGLGPSRKDAMERLMIDVEPKMRAWAADRFGLHPQLTFNQPVVLGDFWDQSWDASVLYCNQAANPGEAHIRRTADKLNAKWHVLKTGHYPMLTMPDETAKIIVEG